MVIGEAPGAEEDAAWDDCGGDRSVLGYIYLLHATSDGFYAMAPTMEAPTHRRAS